MRFTNEADAITYVFRSMRRINGLERGPDEITRDIQHTRHLIQMEDLLAAPREYAVITGSKGKGSTTAIMAKLLQSLGHNVGMLTSPHMIDWRERIRINGRMIPEVDFLRILSDIAPSIDQIEANLSATQYFSPQGIFLAIALRWFDEQQVPAAVLEVGRGGRFDDIAVVPNKLSLFTPILLEHTHQLGSTLERIAWHKAGIIKPQSYAYSLPQASEVLNVLQSEADAQDAEFAWIAPQDLGEYIETNADGIKMRLGRYGDMQLNFFGRYQIDNATLAVQGAGNMHGRLAGIPHASPEYTEAIQRGLATVQWPGRLHKLPDKQPIYVDGATTVIAAKSMLLSLQGALQGEQPVTILAIPYDRDYSGVYEVFAAASKALILTENNISPNVRFPESHIVLAAARSFHKDVSFAPQLDQAISIARTKAGKTGAILIAAALPVVAEALKLWGMSFESI
jgi:dihydrofolate synthase / folylpolyglutamate synthase